MYFCCLCCPLNFYARQRPQSGSTMQQHPVFTPGGIPTVPVAPPSSPPAFIPSKTSALYMSYEGGPASFLGAIPKLSTCINEFVYLWLRNGEEFWTWVTGVTHNSIIGFRWNGSQWSNLNINYNQIYGVACYNPFITTSPSS